MNEVETVLESTWPWPVWTAVVGLVALLAVAWLLYRREPRVAGRGTRFFLVAARLAVCGIVVWILGGWQRQQHRTEPAQILVAIDDSVSMSFADEYGEGRARTKLASLFPSTAARSESLPPGSRLDIARQMLTHERYGWLEWLRQNYRVEIRLISDTVRELPPEDASWQELRPTRPASRLGNNLRDVLTAAQGVPTSAVLVFTDGVVTAGPGWMEAAEAARRQGVPLFLVGVGGRQRPRDIRITDLVAEDVAFAGDVVQLEVQLVAEGLQGQRTVVRLQEQASGAVLAEQTVAIDQESVRLPVRLTFRPQTVGPVALRVEAAAVTGESDTANNWLTHTLHVNDIALRVLLVQAYPSYEFRFLQNLLGRATRPSDPQAKAFELTTVLQEADREYADQDPHAASLFPIRIEELYEYDVVLFGDVDPTLLGRTAMENLVAYVRDHGGSVVFMAGPRFTPQAFRDTPLASLFPFDLTAESSSPPGPWTEPYQPRLTPTGALNPACQLEIGPAENAAVWKTLPELFWFSEIARPHPGARVLLEHPARKTPDGRPLPLILTEYASAGRVVYHAIDETYRWARHRGRDDYYARYWLQTLRALSRPRLLAGQSSAELSTDRQQYLSGDEIQMRVRFRRPPTDLQQITVMLEQSSGARQPVTLNPKAGEPRVFTGRIRDLDPGSYRMVLTSPLLDPAPPIRSFTVAAPVQEQIGVPLAVEEMQAAARLSGGEFAEWYQADRLLRRLPRGERLRVESLPPEPVWNSPWIAGLLVAILSVEWLVRKRIGLL